ncbi:MAG TPA: hypothetical protein VFZ09_09480 [Archangium sp.]|uniref:WD40/YVTN/BNR-like repeat-containing protein n=1 Tax=Archangium sp. TaxID=1872627 RepID=UPI002E31132A|nr:hypothetical protein [Archangium sp.]HEX5746464.1 hypothetical protein [Archangium sp.]
MSRPYLSRAALALACLLTWTNGCKREEPPAPDIEKAPACPTAAELDALPLPAAVPTTGTGSCRDGWCWVSHEPQGHHLHAVWAHPTGGVWMAGQAGTVLHQAPQGQWTWQSTPTSQTLRGIWGASPADLWAVGDAGTLLHFDGSAWTAVPAPGDAVDLLSVEGASSHEVWAAGKSGRLLRWNGSAWALVPSGTSANLRGVSVLSADDVWVGVEDAGLLRCTPTGCAAQAVPSEVAATTTPVGMWERNSGRWVTFGAQPESYFWKDGAWSEERIPPPPSSGISTYSGLWVGGANDAWVFVYQTWAPSMASKQILHWDGSTWTTLEEPRTDTSTRRTSSLWNVHTTGGSGPSDLWAVGDEGAILRWDGSAWRDQRQLRGLPAAYSPSTPSVREAYFVELSASPDGAVVWANPGGPSRVDVAASTWATSEGTWHAHLIPPPRRTVSSPQFTVSGTGIQPLQGLLPGDPEPWRTRVHASARDNVWAMDQQRVWAWEGQAWRIALEGQGELFAVWTHGPKDTWVAGTGKLLHWDGEGWQEHPTPGFTASALWGSWRRDMWAVGRKGDTAGLFHWDGKDWSEVSSDALQGIERLLAVTGRCTSEVYAVGTGGALLHWDGASWRRMALPTTLDLYGVTPVGRELWVSGAQGAILRQPRPTP